ncbi:ATP-binding cassette domain-containing protein [uncultured Granulicatella sp.]|uniref:ABC transporter ATP-binding protein n=1 Tax=uncultured Granulicatella sp. TaxID=316089 RepID=UPI00260F2A52|nr:ATP-binding cassette domain-containing protein [uncultured Granulicatella sp.]
MSIEIQHLSKTFFPGTSREHKALKLVSLSIQEGDFITIVGGNGAGKSTFLNAIAGNFSLDEGTISFGGHQIERTADFERAAYISRVFQDPMQGTAPRMTVAENLALANRRGQKRSIFKMSSKEELQQFEALLAPLGLGLEDRLHTEIGLLSGGQRQAISLLMATMNAPKLLLLDEHTAALDPKTQRKIMQKTQETIEEKNLTALMITHNLSDAIHFGNRLIVMHRGEIVRDFVKEEKAALTEEELFRLMNALDEADLQGE